MSSSLNQKLVALCSAAVLSIAGYSMQQAAKPLPSAHAAVTTLNRVATHHKTHHKVVKQKKKVVVHPKKKTTVANLATQALLKQKYKNGTYSGVGQTQIGAVQVAVTLKKDRIIGVKITGADTHYPVSYIDPILPQELLARQDINKIDVVSGATLSTADFYYGVVSALQKAQQAQVKYVASVKKAHHA